jgi:hypothetical protein
LEAFMKLAHGIGLLGTFAVFSCGAWLGCSSDDSSSSPPPDGGTNNTNPDSGGNTNPDSGGNTNPDSGGNTNPDSGTDGGAPLSCAGYCTSIMAACTGDEAQYQSQAECLTACAFFPPDTATTGDTLGCRTYHAGLAVTAPNPHCWHAGPFGSGVCGGSCEDFCLLAVSYCSPDAGYTGAPPYASITDCTATCANYASITPDAGSDSGVFPSAYNATGTGDNGNTLECREYHLGNAMLNAGNQPVHCPHTAPDSGVCQ